MLEFFGSRYRIERGLPAAPVHDPCAVAYLIDPAVFTTKPAFVAVELRGDWTVRLIGAGTLSKRLRTSPPAFNEIRIADGGFETLARTLSPEPKHPISEITAAGAQG